MNIIEAAKAMREGKRVRRPGDDNGAMLWMDNSPGGPALVRNQWQEREYMWMEDLLADDWEAVDENGHQIE